MNEWVIAIEVGEVFLVFGFERVVKLFGEALFDFCNEFIGAEAFETERQQGTQ